MASTSSWHLAMTNEADKAFNKLDKPIKQRIIKFFEERVLPQPNPRQFGKMLVGDLAGYWSFRIGDYRAICDIRDNELIILMVDIDHRRQVYDT
ncbi:type II toxin-antitoxin system RelE family toxin [Candidatus Paracaedibacter symbiosus]|uniref:type II toxin-antitoxin system RelE family toxin n=1 Tax=Candidatus Paracaedibacter symbiosus TaxID=244582 RepID=UPI001E4A7559|nr:type II toxin-antitoxin system RelE/ParE family toxin [Candidatus Paracaedibacter symbiosus]